MGALVQAAGATPGLAAAQPVTLGAAMTAGNFGFATARFAASASIVSVIDNLGNAWTFSTPYSGGGGGANAYAYRYNVGAATTLTWTFNVNQTAQLNILEYSGVLTSAALDTASSGATGTSTSPLSDALVTGHANEVAFGVISSAGTETFTQSGSWQIATGSGAPTARAPIVFQEFTGSGSSAAAAVAQNSSLLWIAQTVAFQLAGGAPSLALPPFHRPLRVWTRRSG